MKVFALLINSITRYRARKRRRRSSREKNDLHHLLLFPYILHYSRSVYLHFKAPSSLFLYLILCIHINRDKTQCNDVLVSAPKHLYKFCLLTFFSVVLSWINNKKKTVWLFETRNKLVFVNGNAWWEQQQPIIMRKNATAETITALSELNVWLWFHYSITNWICFGWFFALW